MRVWAAAALVTGLALPGVPARSVETPALEARQKTEKDAFMRERKEARKAFRVGLAGKPDEEKRRLLTEFQAKQREELKAFRQKQRDERRAAKEKKRRTDGQNPP